MAGEESTNQNYLAILGSGSEALYYACVVMRCLESEGATTMNLIRGYSIVGPKSTDPERCVVLAAGYTDPREWSLIDYRETVSDKELEGRRKALIDKLDPKVRDDVRAVSTQDRWYWQRAVRS